MTNIRNDRQIQILKIKKNPTHTEKIGRINENALETKICLNMQLQANMQKRIDARILKI